LTIGAAEIGILVHGGARCRLAAACRRRNTRRPVARIRSAAIMDAIAAYTARIVWTGAVAGRRSILVT
jgi:hypothetical protein